MLGTKSEDLCHLCDDLTEKGLTLMYHATLGQTFWPSLCLPPPATAAAAALTEDGVFFAHTLCTFRMETTGRQEGRKGAKITRITSANVHVPAEAKASLSGKRVDIFLVNNICANADIHNFYTYSIL